MTWIVSFFLCSLRRVARCSDTFPAAAAGGSRAAPISLFSQVTSALALAELLEIEPRARFRRRRGARRLAAEALVVEQLARRPREAPRERLVDLLRQGQE